MTNIIINNTNLTCTLQQDNEISQNKCYTGIFSKRGNSLKFEEAIRKGRAPRNPKLFDGKYITLVRKTNGKYQIHAKALRIEPTSTPPTLLSATSRR